MVPFVNAYIYYYIEVAFIRLDGLILARSNRLSRGHRSRRLLSDAHVTMEEDVNGAANGHADPWLCPNDRQLALRAK